MTYSETKFRRFITTFIRDPIIYVKKIPDKKQTGFGTGIGLPDYLVITAGRTVWFEVKQANSGARISHTFAMTRIYDSQWREFNKMDDVGAEIFIAIYMNKKLFIVPYKKIRQAKFEHDVKSVKEAILEDWRLTKW